MPSLPVLKSTVTSTKSCVFACLVRQYGICSTSWNIASKWLYVEIKAFRFSEYLFIVNIYLFLYFTFLFEWCLTPYTRMFHFYDDGQNYGGRKAKRARRKPTIIWRLLERLPLYRVVVIKLWANISQLICPSAVCCLVIRFGSFYGSFPL